jgi:glycosyltransferase involved in cell wall biosynthesis
VRLVFVGTHPRARHGPMPMLDEAVALARTLGALDRHVFFNAGWVPYAERQNALLESDIGVSAHPDHLEGRFAFRVRLLDYFWAGLPALCTRGDDLADAVVRRGAGEALAPGDVDGWVAAIVRLLEDPAAMARCRAGSRALAGELTWERAVAPLREFCRAPRRAADRGPRLTRAGALASQIRAAGRLALMPGGLGAVWRRVLGRRPSG